jgi:hypothetical protein
VRAIATTFAGGDLALAWSMRDRTTGRTHVLLRWRGHTTTLHEGLEQLPMTLVSSGGAPWLAYAPRAGGEASLQLTGVDGRVRLVRRTALTVTGISASAEPDGRVWVSWLEGIRESTPLGVRSDWTAYLASVGEDGTVSPATRLAKASVTGSRDASAVSAAAGGAMVLFPDADGALRLATVAAEGGVTLSAPLGRGSALAVLDGRPLWTDGTSVVAGGADDAAPVHLAWSPVTIEGADAAVAGGVTALAWYGSEVGGGRAVYASDDARPFRPEWQDRVAARMGWNPWFLWTEAGGQLLTSALVGLLGTVALFPLLWLGTLLIPRLVPGVARLHGALGGALLAALLLLAGWAWASWRSATVLGTPAGVVGAWPGTLVALLLGAGSSLLLLRRGDRETHANALAAAGLTAFLALGLMAFLAFPDWAPLVGLRP